MTITVEKMPRLEDSRHPARRLTALFDPDTMHDLTPDDASGMATAQGRLGGVETIAFCADATVMGGALGAPGCRKVVEAYERAMAKGWPVVGVWHSGGARLADGVASLHGVGEIFAAMTRASGVVPQISVVLGPAAGGAAYGPALTDVVIAAPEARVFVTGPDVIRSVTGEVIDMQALGGPEVHAAVSGVVHLVADDETDAFERAREVVGLLGQQGAIGQVEDRDMSTHLPDNPRRTYDVRPLVRDLVDAGSLLELHEHWAPNVTVALSRLGGRTIGVIANNPAHLCGCLDSASAEKAARFVRLCDAFGIPLIVVVDTPGYLPGVAQEWDGIVRRGAKLLHAFAASVVPRVTLVTRKSFGGAYIAMNATSLGATAVFAWPSAEIAVMGAASAVRILHRRELAAAAAQERAIVEARLIAEHEIQTGGVAKAVELGVVDKILEPHATRSTLAARLRDVDRGRRGMLRNIPL